MDGLFGAMQDEPLVPTSKLSCVPIQSLEYSDTFLFIFIALMGERTLSLPGINWLLEPIDK